MDEVTKLFTAAAIAAIGVFWIAMMVRTTRGATLGELALRAVVRAAACLAWWADCLYQALDSFAVRWVYERRRRRPGPEIDRAIGEPQPCGAAPTGLERVLGAETESGDGASA